MANRTPRVGDTVTVWGESFVFTENHPKHEELTPLLHKYDELAANAYERIVQINEEEANSTTNEKAAPPPDPRDPKAPPPKLDAFSILEKHHSTDEALNALWTRVNTVPDWVDWDQIARGQDIFYRYTFANLTGLAYQSLFVGLAAQRPVEVLLRTGGFSPAASKARAFETGQWNLQVTKDVAALKPGGEGWESTVRVRLLHSAVRSRIRKMAAARPEYFNEAEWGVPINDFDQAITICGFCSAPIWSSLPRQKIKMREQEIIDYVALWRYIAYVIGAPEQYFETTEKSKILQECALLYEVIPNENSRVLAFNLLNTFAGKAPLYIPAGLITAGARGLAGDELCDELEVVGSSFIWRRIWETYVVTNKALVYGARSVPWLDKQNIKLMRKLTWKLIVDSKIGMGGQKTKYHFKYRPHFNLTKAE